MSMNWLGMLITAAFAKAQPRVSRKGKLNKTTVKGDKLARAHSRHGSIYGKRGG